MNNKLIELLYIISNYQKGKISFHRLWNRKYVDLIKETINILKKILILIKFRNKKLELEVLTYIERNRRFFWEEDEILDLSHLFFIDEKKECIKENIKYLEYMFLVLEESYLVLEKKEKKYKLKIYYLFMIIHNIPRIYIENDYNFYFNINMMPISYLDLQEIIRYYEEKANIYLFDYTS